MPLLEEAEADTEVPASAPKVKLGTGTVKVWPNKVTLGVLLKDAPNQPALAFAEKAVKAATIRVSDIFFITKVGIIYTTGLLIQVFFNKKNKIEKIL